MDALIEAAIRVREHAYAPYSHYRVGAAIQAKSGKVFVGCNMENASFGGTICAERAALAAAVSAGEREFTAIAVAGGETPLTPCGICRQQLFEFSPSMDVFCVTEDGAVRKFILSDLLPEAFILNE